MFVKKKFKILIVGSFLSQEKNIYGGIARSCQTMMQSSFPDRFIISFVDSTQISNPPPGIIIRSAMALRRLLVFIGKLVFHRPDCVLLFTSVGASFIEKCVMAWISRLFGCPALIFPRGGELINQAKKSGIRRAAFRMLLKGSRVFLAQGPKWLDFAVNDMCFEPSRVHLISNWTATQRHLSIGSNREFQVCTQRRPRVLFVGWLEEFKGVFELLKVCQKLTDRGIQFELTLAGRGHAELEAKRFVKRNNLEQVVTFTGWADSVVLEQLLTSHDIFILPSWAEGMPNSMIEAMAAGLAVVVTSVGMVTDFLCDEEHALIIPPRDIELLENAVQRVIIDDVLRKNLARKGHQLARKQFSVEPAMEKLGNIIEATIGQ